MENESNKKVLNPFALSPETDARFRLMLVAAIVLSLILGNYLPVYFLPDDLSKNLLSPEVDFTGKGIVSPGDLKDSGMNMILNSLEYIPSILAMVFILAVTFICGMIIYKRHPNKIISEQKLINTGKDSSDKYLRLNAEIRKLSEESGIYPPDIYIAPHFTSGAQAFGVSDHKSIRIDNGLRLMFFKNYEKFRSIILHELGHIANRDVSKTYMAQSVWKTVLFVFAVPTTIIVCAAFLFKIVKKFSGGLDTGEFKELLFQGLPAVIILLFSLAAFFIVVRLLLKSILRTREFYADWRAAVNGAKESLTSYFSENINKEKKSSGVKKLFSWHPSIKERIDCLNDPSVLFMLKYDLCFYVGLLIPFSILSILSLGKIAVSFSGIISGTGQVISQDLSINFLSVSGSIFSFIIICFVPFLITSYLIASSLGLQIQRSVIDLLNKGTDTGFGIKKTLRTAFFVTLGMTAGSIILPYFSVLNVFIDNGLKEILLEKIPIMILAIITAFIMNFLWVYYVKFYTAGLFGRYIKSEKPVKRNFIFKMVSAMLLSLMILPVAVIYFNIYSTKIELLNEFLIVLLIAVPVIYLIVFALTGFITGILNSKNQTCSKCGNQLPSGNLIGKNCDTCHSVINAWLYL